MQQRLATTQSNWKWKPNNHVETIRVYVYYDTVVATMIHNWDLK